MQKPRSDSLYSRLQPAQRDALMDWLVEENVSYEEAAKRCEEQFGLRPSAGSLCGFRARHSFQWRADRARSIAQSMAAGLPPNAEAAMQQAYLHKQFAAAFEEMTSKELLAFERLRLAAQELEHKKRFDAAKLELMVRRVKTAEELAQLQREKIAAFQEEKRRAGEMLSAAAKTKGGITPETLKKIRVALGLEQE